MGGRLDLIAEMDTVSGPAKDRFRVRIIVQPSSPGIDRVAGIGNVKKAIFLRKTDPLLEQARDVELEDVDWVLAVAILALLSSRAN